MNATCVRMSVRVFVCARAVWAISARQDKYSVQMHAAGSPSTSTWEGGDVYHTMVRSGDFCRNSSCVLQRSRMRMRVLRVSSCAGLTMVDCLRACAAWALAIR